MKKVIELEGRAVTITFKEIEINGKEVLAPAVVSVEPLPDIRPREEGGSVQAGLDAARKAETD